MTDRDQALPSEPDGGLMILAEEVPAFSFGSPASTSSSSSLLVSSALEPVHKTPSATLMIIPSQMSERTCKSSNIPRKMTLMVPVIHIGPLRSRNGLKI